MKRFICLFLSIAVTGALFPAEDIFSALEDMTKWELADAYSQVADRFDALGQKKRSDEFRQEAKAIYPSYPEKPSVTPRSQPDTQAAAPVQGVAVDPLTGIPDRPAVRQANIQGGRIARFQFARMLRGFGNEDLNLILSAVRPPLSINRASPLEIADMLVPARDFFTAQDASGLAPTDLFRMETLSVSDPSGADETVILSLQANPQAPAASLLPFWKEFQKYSFTRTGDTWKLTAIDTSDSPF